MASSGRRGFDMNKTSQRSALGRREFSASVALGGLLTCLGASAEAAAECGSEGPLARSERVPVRRAYADGVDGQIHYRFAGRRGSRETPLICLHPSPMSGAVFDVWLGEMGRDRFAAAPDAPGYGGSDMPRSAPGIADYADAMIAFMDSMKLRKADLMGYYTGSMIAADLAVRYPDRVRKVVMVSAPIFNEAIRTRYEPTLTKENPDFIYALTTLANNLRRAPLGEFPDLPSTDRYADIMVESLRQYRTSNWGYRAAFAYDLTTTLPRMAQPLLVVNLDDFLKELTRLAAPYLRNGRIHEFPGWNSGSLDTRASEIASVVRCFLAER